MVDRIERGWRGTSTCACIALHMPSVSLCVRKHANKYIARCMYASGEAQRCGPHAPMPMGSAPPGYHLGVPTCIHAYPLPSGFGVHRPARWITGASGRSRVMPACGPHERATCIPHGMPSARSPPPRDCAVRCGVRWLKLGDVSKLKQSTRPSRLSRICAHAPATR